MGKVRKSGVSIDVSKPKNRPEKLLKMLADLVHEEKLKKHPAIPGHAVPKTRFKDSTTNGLTQAVIKFLEYKGHYCSRIQSQGQYNPTLGRWTKSTVKRGIGDALTVIGGRTVMLEFKVGRDRQSQHQKKTQREVEASGGIYLIVKSYDQFMEFYNTITTNR